jgi:hypothetical protein
MWRSIEVLDSDSNKSGESSAQRFYCWPVQLALAR